MEKDHKKPYFYMVFVNLEVIEILLFGK